MVPTDHKLPTPATMSGMTLTEALCARRSVRELDAGAAPLTMAELGQVCHAMQGETSPPVDVDALGHYGNARRAAPSGGAVYPLRLYVIVRKVEGLAPGVYKYEPPSHHIYGPLLQPLDHEPGVAFATATEATVPHDASALELAAGHQTWLRDALALIVVAGSENKTRAKGGLYERFAAPLVCLEAGMVVENGLLQAAALNLAATPVGAFEEAVLRERVAVLAPDEKPYLLMPIGRRRAGT